MLILRTVSSCHSNCFFRKEQRVKFSVNETYLRQTISDALTVTRSLVGRCCSHLRSPWSPCTKWGHWGLTINKRSYPDSGSPEGLSEYLSVFFTSHPKLIHRNKLPSFCADTGVYALQSLHGRLMLLLNYRLTEWETSVCSVIYLLNNVHALECVNCQVCSDSTS